MRQVKPGIEVSIHHTPEDDTIQIALDLTAQLLSEAQEHAWACAVNNGELNPLEAVGAQVVCAFNAQYLNRYFGQIHKETW